MAFNVHKKHNFNVFVFISGLVGMVAEMLGGIVTTLAMIDVAMTAETFVTIIEIVIHDHHQTFTMGMEFSSLFFLSLNVLNCSRVV